MGAEDWLVLSLVTNVLLTAAIAIATLTNRRLWKRLRKLELQNLAVDLTKRRFSDRLPHRARPGGF